MFDFVRPGFLVAGALAALIPVVLHLIARHPPERAPLPTLRFLRPDARRAVRMRRPTDLLLLTLRVLFLVLLGLGFAGLSWSPERSGTAEIVLLDRSTGGQAWPEAVEAARRLLLPQSGEPGGILVVFDSVAEPIPADRVTEELFSSLLGEGPGEVVPNYAVALRSIPTAAAHLEHADSIRVTLISSLTRQGWRPGLAHLRRAAWPGQIHIPELPPSTEDADPPRAPLVTDERRAAVITSEGEGGYVRAALEAAGWTVEDLLPTDPLPAERADAVFVLEAPAPAVEEELVERLHAGTTLIVEAGKLAPGMGDSIPWRPAPPGSAAEPGKGAVVFSSGLELEGAAGRVAGSAAAGARVLGVWEDGRPAIVAVRSGSGCLAYIAFGLEEGSLPLSPAYPLALDRLTAACAEVGPGTTGVAHGMVEGNLDSGGRTILRGPELPAAVASASMGGSGGVDLSRWLLAVALAIAFIEAFLMYWRGRVT